MWLIIDTSDTGSLRLYYSFGAQWECSTQTIADVLYILPAIEKLCSEHGTSASALRGVGVIEGVGTFTGTRVATTIANTLHFAHLIPLVACDTAPIDPPEQLFAEHGSEHYILPRYSSGVSIGGQRTH